MIGSLTDLSRRPDMPTELTLRRMIHANPDFPVVRHGRPGRAYRIDLDAAEAFIRGLWAAEAKKRADREAFVRSFREEFLASRTVATDQRHD